MQNTTLCSVSLPIRLLANAAIRKDLAKHLITIRYFSAINRVGRLRLIEHPDPVPNGVAKKAQGCGVCTAIGGEKRRLRSYGQ
jgi:hypothetical protein